jgi:hypothetical protein
MEQVSIDKVDNLPDVQPTEAATSIKAPVVNMEKDVPRMETKEVPLPRERHNMTPRRLEVLAQARSKRKRLASERLDREKRIEQQLGLLSQQFESLQKQLNDTKPKPSTGLGNLVSGHKSLFN